ncbi:MULTISPECIES: hypothetical protein [Streptomyces]|uniref:hypothetical protein n=1 Tax=Streptomyces TaxID=1883 RepID=UPI00163BD66C|nr:MULTISPECIES: hypothetical protein [Streptomyces]MBC2877252.1 hypothetical protein [Streptomyces sp. TYQ1024]UBI39518.1 hypothetical protein K7I03_25630 [Streptomyces mobaraensis]UKW32097.1 hypothetical protein MCU78_25565 [Streptomyces sp. TYQ1024]
MLARTALMASVLAAAAQAATGAAQAGGLGGGLLSPAIGNGCANRAGAAARGSAHALSSAAGGNHVAVPGAVPTNQCGGADVPIPIGGMKGGGDACLLHQFSSGTDALSGSVLNEAAGSAPVDVVVQAINVFTNGGC